MSTDTPDVNCGAAVFSLFLSVAIGAWILSIWVEMEQFQWWHWLLTPFIGGIALLPVQLLLAALRD